MNENFEHLYSVGTVLEARAEIDIVDSSGNLVDTIKKHLHCVVFLATRSGNEQYYGLRKYDPKNHNVGCQPIYLQRDLVEGTGAFKPLGNLNLDERQKEWSLTLLENEPIPGNFVIPASPSTIH